MTATLKFVEAPAASPVTVLDVNGGPMRVKAGDFTLGAPEWTTEPLAVDEDDGYREAKFTVGVDGSYTNAAAAVSALSRVLQRPKGWLMFQREIGHKPMFLRWYRTPPSELSWDLVGVDTYRLPVTLTCDPYLYGEPITLSNFTVTNNPATGTNPAFRTFAANTFVGDAPAPLTVKITPTGDWHGYQPLMASTALAPGQTQSGPYWYDLTAAGWTAGTNVGADVADANYVGGSYRSLSSGGTMVTRLSGTLTSPPPLGTYKVMLRVATSTDQCTFAVRFGQKYSSTQARYGDTKTLVRPDTTITTYATWMDLGEFTFPYGASGLDPTQIGPFTAPDVEIQAQVVSAGPGTATLRFDALLLIPVDTAATLDAVCQVSRFNGLGIEVVRTGYWDGQNQTFVAKDSDTNRANLRQPEIRGGWLRVVPGVVNTFHLLQQTQVDTPFDTTLDDDDEIANTTTVTLSYLPRYLHLRPAVE